MCAPSFSRRWREVAAAETQRRAKLSTLRKTPELVNFLQEDLGGHWKGVAEEYGVMQAKLAELHKSIEGLRKKRRQLVNRAHELKAQIEQLQHQKGEHWRAKLFEKVADPSEYAVRESFESQIQAKEEEVREVWAEWREVKATQDAQTSSNDVQEMMRRRESIALEVELARIKLIREAVTASIGMSKAGQRPSAWWFPLLCPDGTWFRSTMRGARMELEQLD
jgi:chromosome segregation ATPase